MTEGGLGGRGAYIGRDAYGGNFVYDPWELYGRELTSPNMLVIGQIGRAKSSLGKTYVWRQSVFRRRAWIIDLKGEYGALAQAFDVTSLALEPGGALRLNPTTTRNAGGQGQLQLLQAVCSGALQRPLAPEEEAGLRDALKLLNAQPDEPTLPTVVEVLLHPPRRWPVPWRQRSRSSRRPADRPRSACSGCVKVTCTGMFDGPTTPGLDLDARLVITDVHHVYDSAALGIVMTCAAAWLRAQVEAQRARAERLGR